MRVITVPKVTEIITRQYRTNPSRALFLWGPPGVGKTQQANAAASELGINLLEVRLGTMVPSDLRGVPVPDLASETTRWLVGEYLPRPERDGERGILLLDEFVQPPPTMQGIAQRLVHERRIGDRYRLPDGWMVVALGNRREDKASVYEMPAQTQNRFKHFLVMPDLKSFLDYGMRKGFHPHILAFLAANESYLHMFDAQAKSSPAWPSPRTWEAANEDYQVSEDAADLEQSVGTRAMDQFIAFKAVIATLPDMDAILDGRGVNEKLPADRNAKFALITGLASKMETPQQGANGFRWLATCGLDDEMLQVYLDYIVKRCIAKNRKGELAQMIALEPQLNNRIQELLTALSHA